MIDRKGMIAVGFLLLSVFMIVTLLVLPRSIQIVIYGNFTVVREIPNIYTINDAFILIGFAFALGASTFYLILTNVSSAPTPIPGVAATPAVREKWASTIPTLRDDEKRLYELVVEQQGVAFQSQLVEKSGMSKSSVSIILDRLEARGLLERRRHGMSNVVVLK